LVLLTKADLVGQAARQLIAEVARVAGGVPIVPVSALTGQGLERIPGLLPAGRTAVLLGQSGAGKSTLVNGLAGEDVMRTTAVRSDGKGRHATTHRQLFAMSWGGLLIDTPGLRAIQVWTDVEEGGGIARLFADVDDLATQCRF